MDFPLVAALQTIEVTRHGVIAVYCLTIYEWLEGLPREIELIYPSRWSSIKLAYFLCRYYALLSWPIILFAYVANHTAQTCTTLMYPANIVLLPMQLFAQGVMAMRAYAFTGRNKATLGILSVCFGALFAVEVWFFCVDVPPIPTATYEILGATGCFPNYPNATGKARLAIAMSASIFMDLVSLCVIFVYCARKGTIRGSLGRTFLSQGLFAFAVVLIVHSISMGMYYDPHSFHNGVGLPCILVVSNIMACRVILDLRRKALPTETELLRQHSVLIEDAFANNDLWAIEDGS